MEICSSLPRMDMEVEQDNLPDVEGQAESFAKSATQLVSSSDPTHMSVDNDSAST